ncbi:hypothetical protein CXB51_024205 [Gossypium anomalum]|uniref:DUF7745 domain-containing protein n=1 Tax=Gossypium anomalum TaxID=47600 RepID=A0A8J5YJ19_9ROSI|nr:hypothetical protein CXB51_024205 [Gossypium anomalum]
MQLEKGDSLAEGYTSELWDFTWISVTQNEFQELRDIWAIVSLLGGWTWCLLWKYTTLLRCPKVQIDRVYFKTANAQPFVKKLMSITGMSEQWVIARIQQKGNGKCISWVSLRDLIVAHPDMKKKVDIFALSIYGLVIFPKALRHIDEAVADLFDRLDKGATSMPMILAETFRSLSAYRKAGESRFIGCA